MSFAPRLILSTWQRPCKPAHLAVKWLYLFWTWLEDRLTLFLLLADVRYGFLNLKWNISKFNIFHITCMYVYSWHLLYAVFHMYVCVYMCENCDNCMLRNGCVFWLMSVWINSFDCMLCDFKQSQIARRLGHRSKKSPSTIIIIIVIIIAVLILSIIIIVIIIIIIITIIIIVIMSISCWKRAV